jgi:hypothetical protein
MTAGWAEGALTGKAHDGKSAAAAAAADIATIEINKDRSMRFILIGVGTFDCPVDIGRLDGEIARSIRTVPADE